MASWSWLRWRMALCSRWSLTRIDAFKLGPPRIRRNSQKSFLKKGQLSWKSCSITLSGGSYQWWLLPHRYPSSHCHQPLPILIFIVNSWRQRELWNLGLDRKARQRGWEEGGDEERSGLVVVVVMRMIMMTMVMIYQFVSFCRVHKSQGTKTRHQHHQVKP